MDKYILTDVHREYLKTKRQALCLSAETVSEKLNHHKSWLGQIERGRLNSIKKDDFIKLLSILWHLPEEMIEQTNAVEQFYNNTLVTKKTPMEEVLSLMNEPLPSNESGYTASIKRKMEKVSDLYCLEQKNEPNQFVNILRGIAQLHENAKVNANYSLLFLGFPYDKVFEKYKDDPEAIIEIYNYINEYLEMKLNE